MLLRYCLLLLLLGSGALPLAAQVGSCDLGSAAADLDANNVRARLYNSGSLFWRGSGNVYTVPKEGTANAIFAASIWIGGRDPSGQLRFAGTVYGPWEFWPGPLDATTHRPEDPEDCSDYDRIWKVTRADLRRLATHRDTTDDIKTWPWKLGAPVVDGDGDPNNYDLDAGDRPRLYGDETLWWVMNDAGNQKGWSQTPPIGLEVQVTAFAYATANPLNNTTFYRYKLIHKGAAPLSDVYLAYWNDPDLGDASDDFIGVDTLHNLGYVYNGDNVDAGVDGYGSEPPALGVNFLQGPLVPAPGRTWTDPDGTVHRDSVRLRMTHFHYYNSDSAPLGNPTGSTEEPYNYMRSIWREGTPVTRGGTGYNPGSADTTHFVFPGDPVEQAFWSEENTDGLGSRNTPADRRFLMSTGPFDFAPGETQEIVFGILWSRGPNRLASVAQLRLDNRYLEGAYALDFAPTSQIEAPVLSATPLDQQVVLEWSYDPASNNYLGRYHAVSAAGGGSTYTFEGFKVYQFAHATDTEGTVIATYDVANDVRRIVAERIDPVTGLLTPYLAAEGTNTGVQFHHVVDEVTNYQTYYFGVQAYAYSEAADAPIVQSEITRLRVEPTPVAPRNGGTQLQAALGAQVTAVQTAGIGEPQQIVARVSNPAVLTGDTYVLRTYDLAAEQPVEIDGVPVAPALAYDLLNETTGAVLVDGRRFYAESGQLPPLGTDLVTVEGLSFSIVTPTDDFAALAFVENAAGPIPEGDQGVVSSWQGFPGSAPTAGAQQANGQRPWIFHTADTDGTFASYEAFVRRTTDGGTVGAFGDRRIVPYDFEMRFTAQGSRAYDPFETGCYFAVPFELWRTGVGTLGDPSDDVQMVPYVHDVDQTSRLGTDGITQGWNLLSARTLDAVGLADSYPADHAGSSLNNDPQTDGITWTTPENTTPGTAGYDAWVAHMDAALGLGTCDDRSQAGILTNDDALRHTALFQWNGGDVCNDTNGDGACEPPTYQGNLPETGSIIRITTTKPIQPGGRFVFDTAALATITDDGPTARAALDQIGLTPNPYKGASLYEVSPRRDAVRFTHLPERATIRVYTLAGTLVRTLEKSGPAALLEWDLTSDHRLPLASGMYLIHVEVPGVGQKVIKFGLIKSRTMLDVF